MPNAYISSCDPSAEVPRERDLSHMGFKLLVGLVCLELSWMYFLCFAIGFGSKKRERAVVFLCCFIKFSDSVGIRCVGQ